jgi:capsular exopolysaccharide synthesis family protein
MGRIEEALRKAKAQRRVVFEPATAVGPPENPEPAAHRFPRPASEGQGRRASHVPANHVAKFNNDRLRQQRIIAASDQDERVGPYRQLRTQLLKAMTDNRWTTLAITSPTEGAGKSVTAANLAISLSRVAGTIVLLVDLDLRTPTIHEKLNLSPKRGLLDFLEGNAELEDILFDPGINGLTVLAGRAAGRSSSELLASERMQELMDDLCSREEGNITIFDLPPLLRNDDAILFAPYADATLIVVEDGVTTESELQQSIRLLRKANFIGTILNKAKG